MAHSLKRQTKAKLKLQVGTIWFEEVKVLINISLHHLIN